MHLKSLQKKISEKIQTSISFLSDSSWTHLPIELQSSMLWTSERITCCHIYRSNYNLHVYRMYHLWSNSSVTKSPKLFASLSSCGFIAQLVQGAQRVRVWWGRFPSPKICILSDFFCSDLNLSHPVKIKSFWLSHIVMRFISYTLLIIRVKVFFISVHRRYVNSTLLSASV